MAKGAKTKPVTPGGVNAGVPEVMAPTIRDRVVDVRRVPARDLIPNPHNARRHPDTQVRPLTGLLRTVGFAGAALARKDGDRLILIDGHARREIAPDFPMLTLITDLSEEEADLLLATYDRVGAMAEVDAEALRALLGRISSEDAAVRGMLARMAEETGAHTPGRTDPDAVPDVPANPVTRTGDLWLCGDHRVLCGDSTKAEDVARLVEGGSIDCLLTDPPYCSGGFQEAGRAAGSIGTKRKGTGGKEYTPRIANDTLSTRGYSALIKSVLGRWSASFAYVFTDWRMWTTLFDVCESSGMGVRNMIVWDKGSPGMGRGWRTQHELVLFAAAAAPEFDNHKAVGNVVSAKRTGNPNHPTEKPVSPLGAILAVTDFCKTIGDPFGGSGSTVIACEQAGRMARLMELAPPYVDVAVRRWQDFTGRAATLDGTGQTFAEVREDRIDAATRAGEPPKSAAKRRKTACS